MATSPVKEGADPARCSMFTYALLTALLAGVNNGYNTVLSTALIPRLREYTGIGVSHASEGFLTGTIFGGSILGIVFGGLLCECHGRRFSIAVGEASIVSGTLLQIAFLNIWYISSVRLLLGFGVGICAIAKPLYLTEIVNSRDRATIIVVFSLANSVGINLLYIMDSILPRKTESE